MGVDRHVGFSSVHARRLLILEAADSLNKSATPIGGHHPIGGTGEKPPTAKRQ